MTTARTEEGTGAAKEAGTERERRSAVSGPERAKGAESPVATVVRQCVTWVKLAEVSPGRGPEINRGSKGWGSENSISSWPWRRASSDTMNDARRGEATVSRNILQPISRTSSFSKQDPSQNCSELETEERDTGWRVSCLAVMCTGDGANRGEPGLTGEHTSVQKFPWANWRKASPGEVNGGGRAWGLRASAPGVRAERKPCFGAGLEAAYGWPAGLPPAEGGGQRGEGWWLILGLVGRLLAAGAADSAGAPGSP